MAVERGFDNHYACRCDRCPTTVEFDVNNPAKTTSSLRKLGWRRFDYAYPSKGWGNGHYLWACPACKDTIH